MKTLTLLLVIVPFVSARCPVGAIQGLLPDDCYLLSEHALNWTSAEQQCTSKDGHLISVTSDAANVLFQSLLSVETATTYWIGGYKEVVQGKWVWSDGKRWSYTNWAKGQPARSSSSSYCVSYDANSGQWSAGLCGLTLPYMCKVPSVGSFHTQSPLNPSLPTQAPLPPSLPSPTLASSTMCPVGWFTLPSSTLCYLVVQENMEWSYASDDCRETYQGQLVSITSPNLQEDLYSKVSSVRHGQTFWIGLHRNDKTDQFQWTDGSAVNYTNWYIGSPTDEDAVTMAHGAGGKWISTDSGVDGFFYICERAPYMNDS